MTTRLKGLLVMHSLLIILLLATGCSGWNSELESSFAGEEPKSKPRCSFEMPNNCWTRSLELITACLPPQSDRMGLLEADRKLCRSEGMTVLFPSPSQLADDTDELEARFYGPEGLCFRLLKRGSMLVIDENGFGEPLQAVQLASGEWKISCLFGESLEVPADASRLGCEGKKNVPAELTPISRLAPLQETQVTFSMGGLGFPLQPLFQCQTR